MSDDIQDDFDSKCLSLDEVHELTWTHVQQLQVRDKRILFMAIRNRVHEVNIDTFFTHVGITAGQFATFHILSSKTRHAATASV